MFNIVDGVYNLDSTLYQGMAQIDINFEILRSKCGFYKTLSTCLNQMYSNIFSNFIPNLDGPWIQHISPGL